jgi:hypothetical protein
MSGCAAQSPAAPDRAAPPAIAGSVEALASLAEAGAPTVQQGRVRTSYSVDLLEGTMSLTLADGTTMWGMYRGTATVPSVGQSRATLEGEVTGGTGMFAGATGTIEGAGIGGFVNDGEFSVRLHATVSMANGHSREVSVALNGISTSTCTTTAPPRVTLDGTSKSRGIGSAAAHLEHNLGAQICAIIVE